jgi:hypothetical protein
MCLHADDRDDARYAIMIPTIANLITPYDVNVSSELNSVAR